MTPSQRATYARAKALRIEELHAIAQGHMDEFDSVMREIDKLERETFDEAWGDCRYAEMKDQRDEERRQKQTEEGVS